MSEKVYSRQHSDILDKLIPELTIDRKESQNDDNEEHAAESEEEESCDECGNSASFQVYNSSNVQIGPTFNFNGPCVVSESCGQDLPLQSSGAEVHLHGRTKAHIGPRVNYNGPITIKQIVNVNAQEYEPTKLPILDQVQVDTKTTVRLIGRRMWLAQPPLQPPDRLKHPVNYVVILHTATEECPTQADCVFMTRQMQNLHIEGYGWWDIGYSFLIGGDGNVYEGRGWDAVGSFAEGYNNLAIGIAVIGTFTNVLPSDRQIHALHFWIQEGVRLGKISPDYKILTHHQSSASARPGNAFVKLIQTWPRWFNTSNS